MTQEMDISQEILSDITVHMKYARYLPEKERRETWEELVTRNMDMHISRYPKLKEEIKKAYRYVYDKKVLPSMRSMQFAGKPIEISPSRSYNCSYLAIDHYKAFSEIMFLLLGGTGVGFSVQRHHVEKLPEIRKPTKSRRFLVGDSIEGWADAIHALMKAYLNGRSSLPNFDFSDIRPKGARLITSGGKAPGPEPLKDCIHNVQKILDRKEDGSRLTTLECHDIVCYIADCVLAGGIRRAALISLFSIDDDSMLTCKFGNWYELNPQRGRANNSAVVVRHRVKKKDFLELWEKVKNSGSGEPGLFFTNDAEYGTNPCGEVALRPQQMCNLTEINAFNVESQEDLNERAIAASFLGTLQASYTDFHYLRDEWKRTCEKDALLGIGMTGIASGKVLSLSLEEACEQAKEENVRVAKLLGINKSARIAVVKPSGTTSLVVGCSSGIHAWHSQYYIRRIRVGKNEAIYTYLSIHHPELLEDDFFKPNLQAVISIPQKAPEGAILRDESPIELLERVKKLYSEWVVTGHRDGSNTHNVSCTVSVKDDEWDTVSDWLWKNKETFNGLSFLPFDNHTYVQAPFEEIDEKTYNKMYKSLKNIDLTKVIEVEDNTDLTGEAACAGGSCEVV